MAGVYLHNLFEINRNFMGLLDPNIEIEVKLCPEFINIFDKKFIEDFNDKYQGKKVTISSLFKDEIVDEPEWRLNEKGELYSFIGGLVKIKGEFTFITLFIIDIKDWLKSLPNDIKRKIAYLAFFATWNPENDIKKTEFLSNIKYIEDK